MLGRLHKRYLRLLAGLACLAIALSASLLSINRLVATPKPPPSTPPAAVPHVNRNLQPRLVARAAISRGQRITRELLEVARIEESRPSPGFTRIDEVAGSIALENIRPGQIIHRAAVATDPDARPGLAMLVPQGMRAVAIRVTDEIAVGNFVRPDDTVDIQLVLPSDQLAKLRGRPVQSGVEPESVLFLQNIKVLSVGEVLTVQQGDKAIRMQNITIAVSPHQALSIAAVKQVGTFYLALRHPNDKQRETETRTGAVEAIGLPKGAEPEKPPSERGKRVEMIMGNQRSAGSKR